MIHRLLAVLSALAMLHVTLVGQLPCAPENSATSAHTMDAKDMGAMDMSADHGAAGHQTPGQQAPERCCAAITGCTVSLTIASATRVAAHVSVSRDIPIADRVALLSFQTAPEPLPPKV